MVDVRVYDHGGLYLLDPLTESGRHWLASNTVRGWKWLSGCLAVERRCAGRIVEIMIADGLEVEIQ